MGWSRLTSQRGVYALRPGYMLAIDSGRLSGHGWIVQSECEPAPPKADRERHLQRDSAATSPRRSGIPSVANRSTCSA